MANKIYKGVGKGESLWAAIIERYGNNEAPQITQWIEDQQEAYMDSEYDYDRINIIVWDLKNRHLIKFLDKIGVDISNEAWDITNHNHTLKKWIKDVKDKNIIYIDRNTLILWMKLAKTENDIAAMEELITAFKNDLEGEREHWAYERAGEEFNDWIQDINTNVDQEVAEFFNVPLEIEGVEIEGDEFDMSEVEFCKNCNEAIIVANMKENYKDGSDEEYDEGYFYCVYCGQYYQYDEEHCRLNKHIPAHIIIARRV